MQMLRLAMAQCAVVVLLGGAASAADLFVAPDGSDVHPGTRDRPFATLERARDAVRALIRAEPGKGVTVHLRGGAYFLKQPLNFGPRDSGTAERPVTYAAVKGEKPVISGGRRITGWKKLAGGTWSVTLPEVAKGEWFFEELFVNGRRATPAREPDSGFYRVVRPGPDNHTSFHFKDGHIKRYRKFKHAAVVLLSEWNTSRIRIAGIDMKRQQVSFAYRRGKHPRDKYRITGFEPHPPYFVENAIELLDTPGEWYLDRDTGVLSYLPRAGEDPAEATAIAPRIDPLVEIRGDGPKGAFVHDIAFEGITFAHCASLVDMPRYAPSQAGMHLRADNTGGRLDAAVRLTAAHRCRFRGCTFEHLGATAVHIERWCVGNRIEACDIRDCGGSGVMIGWNWSKANIVARNNSVVRCRIHDCGKRFFGAIGVWAGITDGTVIAHNDICNLPYTGVSVGWRWDSKPTPCANNRVEFNHIHHVMQTLSDGAGIYTLGRQPGTVLRGNLIHDVVSHHCRKYAQGLYNDMGSSGITSEGNAVYAVGAHCMLMHRAEELTVRDNVFVENPGKPALRFAHTQRGSVRMEGNTIAKGGRTSRLRLSPRGRSGNALLCDGLQSFVSEPHAAELDPAQLTLEAWVQLERYSSGKDTRRWVASKNANEWAEGHYALVVSGDRASGCLNLGGGKGNLFTVSGGAHRLKLKRWHHLALTYDGSKARLYLDGKQCGERAIGRKRTAGKGPFAIGRRPDGFPRRGVSGLVDEVRLYRRALTAEEIRARAAGKAAGRAQGDLVKAWDFDKLKVFADRIARLIDAVRKRAGTRGTGSGSTDTEK